MKRGKLLIFLGIILVLSVSLISAGFFSDFWGKITGYAESGQASVNITIGNAAPTIPFVQAIIAQDPTIGSTTSITFNYTATDTDGFGNLDNTTADAYFQRAGESTRSNTSCDARNASTNSITYSCTIKMWYFDQNGAWTINATIKDINSAYVENSTTTFTYNIMPAMTMSPTSLTWPAVGLTSTNIEANQNITVNNSGNDIDLNINVTALNLRGETTTTQYIYANNLTVKNETQGTCTVTAMVNATSINVTSAILQRGNNSLNYWNATSGQEQIVFCLKGVPQDISAQSYSSSAYGSWTVAIIT